MFLLDLRYFGILRNAEWYFLPTFLDNLSGLIFKGQLSVTNYNSTLRCIPRKAQVSFAA